MWSRRGLVGELSVLDGPCFALLAFMDTWCQPGGLWLGRKVIMVLRLKKEYHVCSCHWGQPSGKTQVGSIWSHW